MQRLYLDTCCLNQTPDLVRQNRVALIAGFAHESVTIDHEIVGRAQSLESIGFQAFDALHIACAEQASAEVLLTTDDQFLRAARRNVKKLHVYVDNPLTWLESMEAKGQ